MLESGQLKPGISVILCTYNGAAKLPETLKHLALQKNRPSFSWELLFVDNNSKDDSLAVAKFEWNRLGHPVPMKIYNEKKAGKYYALQLAIEKATYSCFVICDDDNWLCDTYLSKIYDVLTSHPEVGAVGGYSSPATEAGVDIPEWFEKYKGGYAVGNQSDRTGYVGLKQGRLWGAGLGSRTLLYREIYREYPSFLIDDNNKQLLITEDTEFCARVLLRGYKLYYDENLRLQHFIAKEKFTEAYREKLYANFAAAASILDKYRVIIKLNATRGTKWLSKIKTILVTPYRMIFAKRDTRNKQLILLKTIWPSIFGKDEIIDKIKDFTKV